MTLETNQDPQSLIEDGDANVKIHSGPPPAKSPPVKLTIIDRFENQDDDNNNIISGDNNNNSLQIDQQDLVPCSLCGRKFLSNRLEKHLIICRKIKEKKRKLFDAAKQRAENLDKINHFPTQINTESVTNDIQQTKSTNNKNGPKKSNKSTTKQQTTTNTAGPSKSNWRQQHEEFIKTIRAARGQVVQEDNDSDYVQGALPPGFVECPTCQRRFSVKAADRHIEWCAENIKKQKDQQAKKNQEALERMKARTKYKPVLPGTKTGDNSKSSTTTNIHRSRSISSISSGSLLSSKSEDSQKTSTSTPITNNKAQQNQNKTTNKKIISKSSENLTSKLNHTKSPSLKRRTTNNTQNKNLSTKPTPPTNRQKKMSPGQIQLTNNNRITTNAGVDVQRVTSKVDTGINPDRNPSRNGGDKKSAPVMKFKEKFPHHHQNQQVKSIIDQFQDIEHILRRNSNACYDDQPKTVPGVRTGGISPGQPQQNLDKSLSRSETNLQKMDGDIKKRIDQYITRLYDNNAAVGGCEQFWPQTANGLNNSRIATGFNGTEDNRIQMTNTAINNNNIQAVHQIIHRQSSSANSEDARMSTSDSTDSGLGVAAPVGPSLGLNGLLETVNEDHHKSSSGTTSKSSARTFRADFISPTMSDIETNNRILLRNGSLNDIELLNNGRTQVSNIVPVPSAFNHIDLLHSSSISSSGSSLENKPRFCHQCGTKYPNMVAKFCYECGSRRYETVI